MKRESITVWPVFCEWLKNSIGVEQRIEMLPKQALKVVIPATEILIYTIPADDDHAFGAPKAGASGCLRKPNTKEEIVERTFDVRQSDAPISGEIAWKSVRSSAGPAEPKGTEYLTPRQQDILGLLAQGFVAKEIAQQLGISLDTVRFHLKNIYARLHVRSKTEAVLKYIKGGTQCPVGRVTPPQMCQ